MAIRLIYDIEGDQLAIELGPIAEGQVQEDIDIAPGITAALDAQGNVLSFEITDARVRLGEDVPAVLVEVVSAATEDEAVHT